VRRLLFDAIDLIFRPLDDKDTLYRKEPASVKKMQQGDANWAACKTILGWILDTEHMTLTLPQRRLARLAEILMSIPPTQKRTTVQKWHKILGELRSMTLAIPGSRGLFSHMQDALRHCDRTQRLALRRGVQDALADFRLLHQDLARRPTRLYELVPLSPTVDGDHDASGKGMGGVLLPGPTAVPRAWQASSVPTPALSPIVWRAQFPPDIRAALASRNHPHGTITNSDLELAGSLLQHEAAVQCFDLRERTLLSHTDNTPTLFWQRKGSTTTTGPPAYLLRAQALHQRHHRYVPRHDFIPGLANTMSDDASRLHHLSDADFLTHFNSTYPQTTSWQLWTPSRDILSSAILALRKRPCVPALLLRAPAMAIPTGTGGAPFVTTWPSTPYCQTSKTRLPSSKSLLSGTNTGNYTTNGKRPSALAPLRMPYGALHKRSRAWVKPTPALPSKAQSISASSVCSPLSPSRTRRQTA
jgi:hypothetical protein